MQLLNIAALALTLGVACANPSPRPPDESSAPPSSTADSGTEDNGDAAPIPGATQMKIRVGGTTLNATLQNNETANAFKAMLPLTLTMADLNANEKHAELPRSLPVNASNLGTIHAGDVMLYGSKSIVVFYKTFSTSYTYTRIGKVDDVSSLAAVLGSENATVTFEP